LIVPTWEEINDNYTTLTRNHLAPFMLNDWRPGRGGQLMLWYGEPGTGKTTALRAMARSWKEWAEIHYITDPEKFFGDHADYMLQVMLDERDSKKWRLLVLEDCGELLAADARRLSGQGLSRFLNAVDGLIGQGLKFMILVTTNEELGKLHAAVSRPGRCAAQIEFGKLKDDEVVKWLTANKVKQTINGSHTLADLFAITEGFDNQPVERKVGFS
jgi:SpoVK/Ycf46/Vps4 family AAA+-type ATPase